MYKDFVGYNYGFKCPTCNSALSLAILVPWWYDIAPFKTARALAATNP